MQYKLVSGQKFFDLNPGAQAIEAYSKLTDQQMWFVCLTCDADYDNPIRTLPERERREKAAKIAGYKSEGRRPDKNARNLILGKVESVEKASVVYRELQYDADRANMESLQRQIQEIRSLMALDKKAASKGDVKLEFDLVDKASKIGQNLPKLIAAQKELEKILQDKVPVRVDIQTFTAADILPAEGEKQDAEEESLSTIDLFMKGKDKTNEN
jgi:hypothetical protein